LHGIRLRIGEIESGIVLKIREERKKKQTTRGWTARHKSHYKKREKAKSVIPFLYCTTSCLNNGSSGARASLMYVCDGDDTMTDK